jgi:hypothetical protein
MIGGEDTLLVFDAKTLERKSLIENATVSASGKTETDYMAVTSDSWHPSRNLLAVSGQGRDLNRIDDMDSGNHIALKADHGRGIDWRPCGDYKSW